MFSVRVASARRAFAALLLISAPIYSANASDAVPIEARAETLRPGQYVWQPQRAPEGRVEIVVSLQQQLAYVFRSGTLIGVSTVSTGREGHETPTGSFTILQKNREHYSNLYDNAPMPFMQRLTWDGIALHAGEIPGRPASHGCVRLPLAFARRLFEATRLGAAVHIIDAAPPSAELALSYATGTAAPPERSAVTELAAGTR